MMHTRIDIHTPFHIDMAWWTNTGRNFNRFLAEIIGDPKVDASESGDPLDFIDPATAEVHSLSPLWVHVLIDRAPKADYINRTTPLTNAVLRALIENLNRPMTAVALQRRISRGDPQTLLRVLHAARHQYGITAIAPEIDGGGRHA